MTYYRHTQIGRVILVAITVGILLLGSVGRVAGTLPWMWPAMVLLAVVGGLFGTLTVEIIDGSLICRFGVGLIRKRFALREIVRVERVRNSWIWGWGIRYTPHGWLYNVSGLDAVELSLTDGKRVRVGTDRPDELLVAIREARDLFHDTTER